MPRTAILEIQVSRTFPVPRDLPPLHNETVAWSMSAKKEGGAVPEAARPGGAHGPWVLRQAGVEVHVMPAITVQSLAPAQADLAEQAGRTGYRPAASALLGPSASP